MPSAGVVTRNLNPLLYRPGLEDSFDNGYKMYEEQYSKFLKTSTVDSPEVKMADVTGPNRLYRLGDGEAPQTSVVQTGMLALHTDREFAAAYAVTRRAQDDDLYGVVNKGANWLGQSAYFTKEYQAAAFLDDLFSGSTFKGQDGLAFCHTAHTLMGSSDTYSNKSTIGFSMAGVTELMRLADNMVNQQGDFIQVQLNKCLISGRSQAVKQMAMKVFGQNAEPLSANHDENMVKKQGNITVINTQFQSSLTNYAMISDAHNDAHFRVRKALETSDHVDPRTRILYVQAYIRFMIYGYNPRGWFGSNPS